MDGSHSLPTFKCGQRCNGAYLHHCLPHSFAIIGNKKYLLYVINSSADNYRQLTTDPDN